MDVFIFGALSLTALVWVLITSLMNEADAEKRRLTQRQPRNDHDADSSKSLLAA